MQWLLALETEKDPISACRLMNIFRRKGLKIGTLAMAAEADGYSLMAVVETPESEVDHLFDFLRRTEGVRQVTCYRPEPSSEASFIFVDEDRGASNLARIVTAFPESKIIFASRGKFLLEVSAEGRQRLASPGLRETEFLAMAPVRTTRSALTVELVGVAAN